MALHKDVTGLEHLHAIGEGASSDPGAVGAWKMWIDTTTNPPTMKVRNATNDAWLTAAQGEKGDQGDPGAPGADGATWYTGSGAPSDGTGANGDFYLRTNGDVYQKAAGTWGSPVANLTGPQGVQGNPGATGAGVPTGGTENQVLAKNSATNYDTKWVTPTTGTGDMLKATYDTDNDGKVNAADAADAVPWSGVSSKPSTFPPESHTHDDRYFTETELGATTDSASGADKIGATAIAGLTGATVQALLEALKNAIPNAPLPFGSDNVPPTVNEDAGDGFMVGSPWFDWQADQAYVCLDNTIGAAVWKKITVTGSDIKLDDLGAPDDNTDLNVSTSAHGLCPKLPNNTTTFLRGDGTYATPGGGVTETTTVYEDSVRRALTLKTHGGFIDHGTDHGPQCTAWQPAANELWVGNVTAENVEVIDIATMSITQTISMTGYQPYRLMLVGDYMYVLCRATSGGNAKLRKIAISGYSLNALNLDLGTPNTPYDAWDLCLIGTTIFASNGDVIKRVVADAVTHTSPQFGFYGLATDGTYLYACGGAVYRFPSTNLTYDWYWYDPGLSSRDIEYDGHGFLWASQSDARVCLFDITTGNGGGPIALTISTTMNAPYVVTDGASMWLARSTAVSRAEIWGQFIPAFSTRTIDNTAGAPCVTKKALWVPTTSSNKTWRMPLLERGDAS